MSLPAQKFREIVFQLLYSYDLSRATDENMLELLSNELEVSKKAVKEAQQKVHHILEKLNDVDALISQTSRSYSFERIQSVERNILRVGVYELLFDETIPEKVAISEAIRLARKFSTKEAATFINAILDTLYKSSLGQAFNENEIKQSIEQLSIAEQLSKEASLKQKDQEKHHNSSLDNH